MTIGWGLNFFWPVYFISFFVRCSKHTILTKQGSNKQTSTLLKQDENSHKNSALIHDFHSRWNGNRPYSTIYEIRIGNFRTIKLENTHSVMFLLVACNDKVFQGGFVVCQFVQLVSWGSISEGILTQIGQNVSCWKLNQINKTGLGRPLE